MSRYKQIEEMAKICHFYDDGICRLCEELLVSCDRKCDLTILVENLYNAGYRKSSEVAREIFEEIETSLSIGGSIGSEIYYVIRGEDYLHYKKKYTEGGE